MRAISSLAAHTSYYHDHVSFDSSLYRCFQSHMLSVLFSLLSAQIYPSVSLSETLAIFGISCKSFRTVNITGKARFERPFLFIVTDFL
jgi:hypothetical protein